MKTSFLCRLTGRKFYKFAKTNTPNSFAMKNVLWPSLILMASATKAQDITDYIWYLDKLVINGQAFYPPANEEATPAAIQLYFEEPIIFVNSGCNGMGGEYILDEANQTFEISEGGWAVTMNECGLQENERF